MVIYSYLEFVKNIFIFTVIMNKKIMTMAIKLIIIIIMGGETRSHRTGETQLNPALPNALSRLVLHLNDRSRPHCPFPALFPPAAASLASATGIIGAGARRFCLLLMSLSSISSGNLGNPNMKACFFDLAAGVTLIPENPGWFWDEPFGTDNRSDSERTTEVRDREGVAALKDSDLQVAKSTLGWLVGGRVLPEMMIGSERNSKKWSSGEGSG